MDEATDRSSDSSFGHLDEERSSSCTRENRKVLAFLRQYEDEIILVVANLSRFPLTRALDLRNLRGYYLR